ncbi:regakine-1-like [Diceros bicornis minor]|uniref:C-C motif chemokine n=1 Tax=Diceros bicornis minor TaxID=77932 RepID=A0A7J7EJT0_DICBM|nr:regakine-1-like [Diceros bicornis minor]KAF5916062.1 hypothetical protein HPG69_003136 [Diceros bicornis minor]
MKGSLATLAFLLIAALHSEANEEPANDQTPCCFSYISRKISLRFVKDYYRTSDLCPMPAVVFLTGKGRQVCVNPGVAWVQEYITYLDSQSK